jgi:hypothetical protein
LDTWNGREVDTQGDAFFAAFPKATEAVAAVAQIQRALAERDWPEDAQVRVRMGLHTGDGAAGAPRQVGPSPYRGLAAFQETDADLFFGREAFTEQLSLAMGEQQPVAVIIGPSGSGKSSAVFAGLLPNSGKKATGSSSKCGRAAGPFMLWPGLCFQPWKMIPTKPSG